MAPALYAEHGRLRGQARLTLAGSRSLSCSHRRGTQCDFRIGRWKGRWAPASPWAGALKLSGKAKQHGFSGDAANELDLAVPGTNETGYVQRAHSAPRRMRQTGKKWLKPRLQIISPARLHNHHNLTRQPSTDQRESTKTRDGSLRLPK